MEDKVRKIFNRVIKFRLWDVINEKMDYDCNISATNDFIMLQYTGMKDKCKTEIYEGDIIATTIGYIVVKYVNGAFNIHDMFQTNMEVIGNVFQNQNLL